MRKCKLRWGRAIIVLLILSLIVYLLVNVVFKSNKNVEKIIENVQKVEKIEEIKKELEKIEEKPIEIEINYKKVNYRLTSYYMGDSTRSGATTGSGLSTRSFQTNKKGWYTYQGKLVLAGATNECLRAKSGVCGKWNTPKSNRHYFNYYDEIDIEIDGIKYSGIILDSCGACMYLDYEERIDIFVSSKQTAIDRGYRGNNPIFVFLEIE